MRTIIISDIHLTDRFYPQKYKFLRNLFSSADQVILNGDFVDTYTCSFETFLQSEWRNLFPLLKEKHTVYLYGNHDHHTLLDNRVEQFADLYTQSYQLKLPSYTLHIEHGHEFMIPDHSGNHPTYDHYSSQLVHGWHYMMLKIFGKNYFRLYAKNNQAGKKWVAAHLSDNQILVCGHTHFAELDLPNRFINTGFVQFGDASYLEVLDDELFLRSNQY